MFPSERSDRVPGLNTGSSNYDRAKECNTLERKPAKAKLLHGQRSGHGTTSRQKLTQSSHFSSIIPIPRRSSSRPHDQRERHHPGAKVIRTIDAIDDDGTGYGLRYENMFRLRLE